MGGISLFRTLVEVVKTADDHIDGAKYLKQNDLLVPNIKIIAGEVRAKCASPLISGQPKNEYSERDLNDAISRPIVLPYCEQTDRQDDRSHSINLLVLTVKNLVN